MSLLFEGRVTASGRAALGDEETQVGAVPKVNVLNGDDKRAANLLGGEADAVVTTHNVYFCAQGKCKGLALSRVLSFLTKLRAIFLSLSSLGYFFYHDLD